MHAMSLMMVVAVAVCTAGQQVQVSEVIQKLREPLTNMPLSTLFRNMQQANTVKFYVDCVTEKGNCDRIGRALQHLVMDQRQSGLCYGCDRCQTERVRYVLDVIERDYPQLACQIQESLNWNGLFTGNLRCPNQSIS